MSAHLRPQRKKSALRLYLPGIGGVAAVNKELEEKNKAREQAGQQIISVETRARDVRTAVENWRKEHRRSEQDAEFLKRWPGGKCVHGHYLPHLYCNVCQTKIIGFDYNREKYSREIKQGMFGASRILWRPQKDGDVDELGENPDAPKQPERKVAVAEENKDLEEIKSEIDFEVWKESQNRGAEMNGAIAREIAHNVASSFLKNKIQNDTVLVGFYFDAMTREIRERAEMMVEVHGLRGLEQLAENYDADKDERDFAKMLLKEYSVREPRFKFNDKPIEVDGEGSITEGELALANDTSDHCGEGEEADNAEFFEDYAHVLRNCSQLWVTVESWRGDKRKVGRAMLAGTFSTLGIPGVDKSKASRLYHEIVEMFKPIIQKYLDDQRKAYPGLITDVKIGSK